MYVTNLSIDWAYPIFDQQIGLDFDKRVNLFVGPNGSGKSSLLDMLSTPALRGWQFGPGWSFQGSFQDNRASQFHVYVSDDWFKPREDDLHEGPDPREDDLREGPDWNRVPWIRISAFRRSQISSEFGPPEETLNSIFQSQYGLDVFDTNKVEVALRLLTEESLARPRGTSFRHRMGLGFNSATDGLTKAMEVSHSCVQQIASEVIKGSAPHNLVEGGTDLSEGLFVKYPSVRIAMAVNVSGEDSVPVDFLSSGTQTSLLWIRFLALDMLYHYDFADDWQEKPAILLIDEIENHLHPTWQRRVIPALLEHFPGLQVFATTHSPFVVAGLKAGQVHLLNRDENGVVTATTNTEDIIGWTADEILRTMMDVDDPTDDATAAAARELRQLRQEGPRDTLEAEEQRQQRMTELRQLVDRDLLAGGPDKARREQFEEEFAAALEQYLKSKELNQDSG